MNHDRKFFAALKCPNPVTWSKDISHMFTALDRDHMYKVSHHSLDLSRYESVKMYAVSIYSRVANGSMPPPGSGEDPWPQEWVDKFGCWIQQGCPQ